MPNTRPYVKLGIVTLACVGWWALLNFGVSLGDANTPPLGRFLNPYEGFYRLNADDYYADAPKLPGLRAPVEVYYDERLVPHIYASTESDLYYVQGYIQAQHRLFQLDLTARSAEGRLSEVLGSRTLELDRVRKRNGGGRLASQVDSLWQLDARSYEAVRRYADGVNAYINSLEPHEYPIEYQLLDFAPELWSPRHTALVALNMAYTLNYRNEDVRATKTRDLIGQQAFDFLFPERDPRVPAVIPEGTPFPDVDTALSQASRNQRLSSVAPSSRVLPEGLPNSGQGFRSGAFVREVEGIGSNNWAVSPSRSASGHALLANDPHLGLTLPSIWFETELHCGNLHVHGVNLPGVPGITIGFNETAAWGVTNVGADVLDWRTVEYLDADQTRYRTADGRSALITYRTETINVRGEDDVVERIAETEFGPIVYTDPSDERAGMAMDWLTLKHPSAQTIDAFLKLNRADNVDEFLAASESYEWPAQNMVYADAAGDIALRISGKLPRRLPEQGRFVASTAAGGAEGLLPDAANPKAVNPAQGYLASTNQVSTDASYPYYYTGGYDVSRARRINQLLGGDSSATVADMEAFQLDDYAVYAADQVPALLRLVKRGELTLAARGQLELLSEWDFRYDAAAFAPIIYDEWREVVERMTWDELTGGADELLIPEGWKLTQLLSEDPRNRWFDIAATADVREDAATIVTAALKEVSARMDSLSQIEGYNWARHKNARVEHLARIPAFSRTCLQVNGNAGTLNAQRGNVGPSWRMVVELGPTVRAQVIYPGGQSGRPGHAHYADMVEDWAAGNYHEVTLRSSVAAFEDGTAAYEHLSFLPGTQD